jgi:hypothetical protein
VVLQYNKRDIADPFAIEELHRRVGLDQAAVFETIATTGHGILATLTTISKHVVRSRRAEGAQIRLAEAESASAATPTTTDEVEPEAIHETASGIRDTGRPSHEILEAAILAEADQPAADPISELSEMETASGTQPDWNAISGSPTKPEGTLGADLRIVSIGQASLESDGGVRLPLVLGDESGQTQTVVLSLKIDALIPGNDN